MGGSAICTTPRVRPQGQPLSYVPHDVSRLYAPANDIKRFGCSIVPLKEPRQAVVLTAVAGTPWYLDKHNIRKLDTFYVWMPQAQEKQGF